MEKMEAIINDSKLPNQLKEYFTSSKSIKEVLTESALNEIEDLYIFYQSLYIFDTSEFSAYTITSLKRCKDLDSFYYYLKKVIDSNLDLVSKDKSFNSSSDYYYLENKVVDKVFKDTVLEFCNLIDNVYNRNEYLNLKKTYISVGKLELLNDLINNSDYKRILNSGISVLEQYENTKGLDYLFSI